MTKDEAEEIITRAIAAYLDKNPTLRAPEVFKGMSSSIFRQGDEAGHAAETIMQLHLARVVGWIAHGVLEARKRKS